MPDTNELVERLSAAAGMIMEGCSPVALTPLSNDRDEVEERLVELDLACKDAGMLIGAAQVLARRDII
jgi:hypothetical protein